MIPFIIQDMSYDCKKNDKYMQKKFNEKIERKNLHDVPVN